MLVSAMAAVEVTCWEGVEYTVGDKSILERDRELEKARTRQGPRDTPPKHSHPHFVMLSVLTYAPSISLAIH
jgi:hypothetical protein